MARQAVSYRERRVLLAGDAAHVHAPAGGQGLNIGVQDAVNLGWKLAQVIKETSPESLLDTYHAERHPIAARVLRLTLAQTALGRGDDATEALRETVSDLLEMDEPRRRYAAMMSGLDVHYDLGEGHPLLGRRMPDLDVVTEDGPQRVFSLLHDARPVLLNFGEPGIFATPRRAAGAQGRRPPQSLGSSGTFDITAGSWRARAGKRGWSEPVVGPSEFVPERPKVRFTHAARPSSCSAVSSAVTV